MLLQHWIWHSKVLKQIKFSPSRSCTEESVHVGFKWALANVGSARGTL